MTARPVDAHVRERRRSRDVRDSREACRSSSCRERSRETLSNHATVVTQSLPFAKIKHQIATFDAQPSNEQGGILVMVTGALLVCLHTLPFFLFRPLSTAKRSLWGEGIALTPPQIDEEQRPMNYTQIFQLLPDGSGSYFVFNDMFKLIYG